MILLSKSYKGYVAGAIAQFATQEEAALVAQGFGTYNAGPVSTGNVITQATEGRAGVAAGQGNVIVANTKITAESKVWAAINQATADGTALYVARIVPTAGQVQIFLNANATATTSVDWLLLPSSQGLLPPQS